MSERIPPTIWNWDGEVMRPRYPKIADKHYVIGENYALVPYEGRSEASHRHFFVVVKSAWENLPEELAVRFPTPEILRKEALIRCGYANSHTFTCSSKAEAARLAGFLRVAEEYAVIDVKGATVVKYTARSQSQKAMAGKEFGESKQKVLDYLAALIGTTTDQLAKNGDHA